MNVSFSSLEGRKISAKSEIENDPMPESDIKTTRSSASMRGNFQIISTTPISMPEMNGSWIQDDWTGGPGQDLWSSPSKYKSSENLDYTSQDGHLELEKSGSAEIWNYINDAPINRYRHRMVWNPGREVFYVFGGYDENNNLKNTLHEYNPATDIWSEKGKTGGPSARANVAMAWDSVNDLLWVYAGGEGWSVRFNDMWCYDPATNGWAKKADGPSDIIYSTAVFDPNTEQIIVYGGYEGDFYVPNGEVYGYSPQTNTWTQKKSFITRMYHDAVWCPKSSSMMVYGGYKEYISGTGYIYVNALNEYFPNDDTWVNHSGMGNRNNPVLAWDNINDNLILHSGTTPSYNNETWYYVPETDEWTKTLNGPPIRYESDGGWDSVNDQFVVFGGRYTGVFKDYWGYYPNAPAYVPTGKLISSVFDPGHKVNPRTVSFQLLNQIPGGTSNIPVKIRVAGSADSPEDANNFIGPNGLSNTYFTQKDGQPAPNDLKGSRYLAYDVILSTDKPLFSPKIGQIKIDYYTYPDSYTYESNIHEIGSNFGLPLRLVNWTSSEPEGTGLEIYFRQAHIKMDLSSRSYEKVTKEQTIFSYNSGLYFQYKVVFTTTEPGYTPVLNTLSWTFNELPAEPTSLTPTDGGWTGEPEPLLSWKFNDPDPGDYQTALELLVGEDDSFSLIYYSSNIIESTINSFRITEALSDGAYYWKVRLRDNYGSWGPWSNSTLMNIDSKDPETPEINCLSHDLENVWYSDDMVRLDWNEPYDISGIAGYSYILDSEISTEPLENITMTGDEYKFKHQVKDFNGLVIYDELPDGVWYFHIRAVDSLGTWSDTATRSVRIDTKAPPVKDLTPKNVTAGSIVNFRFELNDTHSGVGLTSITYRYESQVDFQNDVLKDEGQGFYSYTRALQLISDSYLEYYIEVDDKAIPINTMRYPGSGYNRINIIDNEPPKITEIPGHKEHNRYINLEINVEATDNVGVKEAKVYFNDQGSGTPMIETGKGKFKLVLDRLELLNMAGYGGEDTILYNVRVWDYFNNSDREPTGGNFKITLLDIEDNGDDTVKKEDEGFSQALMFNILLIVVIVVIVGIVLFFFIRKQGEKISEDRHELRMAIVDAQEGASGAGPPRDLQAGATMPFLQGSAGYTQESYGTPAPQPTIDGRQAAQVPYLPEAQGTPTAVSPGLDHGSQQKAGSGNDKNVYRDAGLMVGSSPPEKPPSKAAPGPAVAKKDGVEVSDGLFISLPGEPSTKPKPTDKEKRNNH